MAIVGKNVVTLGLRGTVSELLVFKQLGGKTVVSQAPQKREREFTEGEKAHQGKFRQAILYGKSVNADATIKAEYKKQAEEDQSAYNVAVADFMNAPEIEEIDVSNYTGAVGSTIRIRATDDFLVTRVNVKIENDDATLAEQADAVLDANGVDWLFTAKKNNATLAGDKITITVNDSPGNATKQSQTL